MFYGSWCADPLRNSWQYHCWRRRLGVLERVLCLGQLCLYNQGVGYPHRLGIRHVAFQLAHHRDRLGQGLVDVLRQREHVLSHGDLGG